MSDRRLAGLGPAARTVRGLRGALAAAVLVDEGRSTGFGTAGRAGLVPLTAPLPQTNSR
jgi:hypothetical protein